MQLNSIPKNMNVSIVLALAGIGFDETKVTLVADPKIDKNIHQVEMTGDFGEATLQLRIIRYLKIQRQVI